MGLKNINRGRVKLWKRVFDREGTAKQKEKKIPPNKLSHEGGKGEKGKCRTRQVKEESVIRFRAALVGRKDRVCVRQWPGKKRNFPRSGGNYFREEARKQSIQPC